LGPGGPDHCGRKKSADNSSVKYRSSIWGVLRSMRALSCLPTDTAAHRLTRACTRRPSARSSRISLPATLVGRCFTHCRAKLCACASAHVQIRFELLARKYARGREGRHEKNVPAEGPSALACARLERPACHIRRLEWATDCAIRLVTVGNSGPSCMQNTATSCTRMALVQSRRWRTCTGRRPATCLSGAASPRF